MTYISFNRCKRDQKEVELFVITSVFGNTPDDYREQQNF